MGRLNIEQRKEREQLVARMRTYQIDCSRKDDIIATHMRQIDNLKQALKEVQDGREKDRVFFVDQTRGGVSQLAVLQSDRDRLTAALEVCTRRLASPAADQDATRAGWRYASEK